MHLNYIVGDVLNPKHPRNRVLIPHVCNDVGAWGAGFTVALSAKYKQPEKEFRQASLCLGQVQFIDVKDERDVIVANMCAQRSIGSMDDGTYSGCPAIRYNHLYNCLTQVYDFASKNKDIITTPKFGAGLAGGDWRIIELILTKLSDEYNVFTEVFDLPKK